MEQGSNLAVAKITELQKRSSTFVQQHIVQLDIPACKALQQSGCEIHKSQNDTVFLISGSSNILGDLFNF